MIKKPCCSRFSLHKFVHLKVFWTQFKNVNLRGLCSLRPCISRPYCISKNLQKYSKKTQAITRLSARKIKAFQKLIKYLHEMQSGLFNEKKRFYMLRFWAFELKANVSQEILNWYGLRHSHSADICIHFYCLS